MGTASMLKDLRAMSEAELVERHDREAKSTDANVNYYLAELARRASQKTADAVRDDTKWVKRLTVAIAILTLANVILVGWSIWLGNA